MSTKLDPWVRDAIATCNQARAELPGLAGVPLIIQGNIGRTPFVDMPNHLTPLNDP